METRKGIFYGVGVGPGDPELLTVKALRTLERCPVIAAPQTKSGEMLALDIVRRAAVLEGKTILPLFFTMARDKSQQRAAHETAADAIAAHLTAGRDVAMLNLGDVSIYATFGYIMDILRERGYEAVMIPGVPSFCAAAARLGLSLVSGETPLHIVPAGDPASLELPGTKVLMKAGKRLPQVQEALTARGLLEQAAMVEDCGLPTEKLYSSMGDVPEAAGYFATVIVKEQ
ncbi:MAG: precorrin-2 C(20)-methyltransferase [Oscillospiraceae bacterium]|nr:precorrin-2 C(20)-methyltransferase [Oscillospiraceae bacterium]